MNNNITNKICNAINEGIESAISINSYVKDLLASSNPEVIYTKIIDLYKKSHVQYVVSTFEELTEIFNKIKNINRFNISWIDLSNVVAIIGNDNVEYAFTPQCNDICFLKIKNNIRGHDIMLHADLMLVLKRKWIKREEKKIFNDADCFNRKHLPSIGCFYYSTPEYEKDCIDVENRVKKDYNGYEHTYNNADIVSNNKDITKYPALEYCMSLNINGHKGYMPSCGELSFLYDNIELIQYLQKLAKIKKLSFKMSRWWTSSESDKNCAWAFDCTRFGQDEDEISTFHKMHEMRVLPLFK